MKGDVIIKDEPEGNGFNVILESQTHEITDFSRRKRYSYISGENEIHTEANLLQFLSYMQT